MGEFSLGFFVGDGGALGDGAGDLGFAVGPDDLAGWLVGWDRWLRGVARGEGQSGSGLI